MESYCCFVVKGKCLQLEGKVKAVLDIEGRAAGTIDDFIHGRQGALWMTSLLQPYNTLFIEAIQYTPYSSHTIHSLLQLYKSFLIADIQYTL